MVTKPADLNLENYNNSTGSEGKKEDAEKPEFQRMSATYNSMSMLLLYVLDTVLLIILLPFMLWQSISANERIKTVLKAAVEISLELIMGIIFAGVAIAMTTTFVLEEIFCVKNEHYRLKQQLKIEHETTTSKIEPQSASDQQDELKLPND